jgi:Zn-dependent peptidase ImmA (M78 family)
MDEILRLGSANGLRLEVGFKQTKAHQAGLAWGDGTLSLEGEVLWDGENGQGIAWTWIDMLAWLGQNWPALMLEQMYPIPVCAQDPGTLLREAERRWEDLPDEIVEDEEERLFRFQARHDLAAGFNGIFLPSVVFMRQGNTMQVSVPATKTTKIFLFEQIKSDFEAIGNGLMKVAAGQPQPRSQRAIELWQARLTRLQAQGLELHSGLGDEARALIENGQGAAFWEYNAAQPEQETELLAAARMTRGLITPGQQTAVLTQLKAIPKVATPVLDDCSRQMKRAFRQIGRPHEQGYWAAAWLRRKLGISHNERIEPADILKEWRVIVDQFYLENCPLDAIACWGQHHGPAIILNKQANSAAGHEHGERSTLAHEICHLLLDRDDALPAAEVLNGDTPERLEKRARAFAAELLMSREAAAQHAQNQTDLTVAIDSLSDRFGVSKELVCWQVQNSSANNVLSEDEKILLKALRSKN